MSNQPTPEELAASPRLFIETYWRELLGVELAWHHRVVLDHITRGVPLNLHVHGHGRRGMLIAYANTDAPATSDEATD